MKKHVLWILTALSLLCTLCGCGQSETTVQASVSVPAQERLAAEMEAAAPAETAVPTAEVQTEPSVLEEDLERSTPVEESAEESLPEDTDILQVFDSDWDEPAVSEMYAEVAEQFEQREYTDSETGLTVPYNLYIPQTDGTEALPMVVFISDSTSVGRDLSAPLTQGYGGIIWATQTEQEKHPSYVLVPEYPEIIIDDNNGSVVTDYVELTARMIQAVTEENAVDTDRIYGTGQSMGCMTMLYLASSHPDLFAAELFVSGQWQIDEISNLDTQRFFYVAAGGDPKASQGQAAVLADMESKGVPVSISYEWDANWTDAEYEAVLRPMLEEGNAIHIGQFAVGSVLEANPGRGIEHMASFDCAYRIDALRNWLFLQHK